MSVIRTLTLWQNEPLYKSPYTKIIEIWWIGELYTATLYIDVDPDQPFLGWGCLTKIYVNDVYFSPEENGDRCDIVILDITSALQKGRNLIKIEFGMGPVTVRGLFHNGFITARLTIEADRFRRIEVKEPVDFWGVLPWIVGGMLLIGGLGVTYLFLKETGLGQSIRETITRKVRR